MIPAAAGLGAMLFIARWRGAVAMAWPIPEDPLEWTGAAGRGGAMLLIVAVTGCALAGIARPGGSLRRWLRWRGRTGRDVVGWALGVSAVAAGWEGLGLAGLIRGPIAWATVAWLGVPGAVRIGRRIGGSRLPAGARWIGLAALLALPPSLSPEIEVDVLSVHLALPDAWRLAGRITADPGWGVSGFPFAQEALHLPALLLGAEPAARLIGWAGGLLAALGAVALAELAGAAGPVAWLAGAATFTMPQLFDWATHAKNDALAAGLVTAALVAVAPGGRAAMVVGGLLAGAAVATKLTAGLVIPALFAALIFRRRTRQTAMHGEDKRSVSILPVSPLDLLLFLSSSSIFLLPWSLRNLLGLGSPCFPALTGIFPTLGRTPVNAELMSRYAFTWAEVRPESWWAALRDLGRILTGFSPVIGAGAALLLATRTLPCSAGWIGIFVLAYIALWIPSLAWVARYLLPVMPAAVALAAAPFAARSRLLAGLVAISLGLCLGGGSWRLQPLAAALGFERPTTYRTRHLRTYQAGLDAVRDAVRPGDRVLVVGDWRRYPSEGRLVAGMSDDTPLLRTLAVESGDAGRLAVRLRQRRIGWVLHSPSQAAYWADYPMRFPWTPRAARAWGDLWDARATLVWRSRPAMDPGGSLWLFRLRRAAGDPVFRAWLPGVEGEYAALRLLLRDAQPAGVLTGAIASLEPAFGGRPEFLTRRAVLRTYLGDRAGAVTDLTAAIRAAPDAVPLWAECGSNVVPRALWNDHAGLARDFDRMSQDHDRWSMLFNLGIPFAIPAPR